MAVFFFGGLAADHHASRLALRARWRRGLATLECTACNAAQHLTAGARSRRSAFI
jgi:hypothetical protein